MPSLPTGTVTFLFTDIEGSTELLQRLGDRRYAEVLEEHHRLLRTAFEEGKGSEVDTQGDAFLVAFPRAREALATAVAAQRALTKHTWPDSAPLRVRMGLHTGEPVSGTSDYVGLDVHRAARICAAAHGGQILLSQTTRELVVDDLPEGISLRDLGEHRLKDLAYPRRLFQVEVADLPADFPPLKTLSVLPNNLPVQLTSFVGREREKAEVKRILSTTRLLTLAGIGGVGKTRLALEVAAEASGDFRDGVWLVELAPLADPLLVPQALTSALGIPEQPGRSLITGLVDHVRPKSILLLLDNCEHVVLACAHLADTLLRACPNLRILTTSRETLGVAGEASWLVPSLSLPDPERILPLHRLTEYEAVRLFIDRAKAALPSFAVTTDNAHHIAQVCRQLDGIPLAIELAAARVKVLTVEQIAVRLDDRFRLLTGGTRTSLPRQQTLRATMDWSYDLLSKEERAALRRLAVFVGGWTLEAAEAICGGDVAAADVLDLLTRLVQRSLVAPEEQTREIRYKMLETVRQYAREKLQESGEEAAIRDRHSQWYLALAQRAEPELQGPEQTAWLTRLDSDHDNFRAGLEWLIDRKEVESALRLTSSLWRFWFTRGYLREGRGRLEAALRRSSDAAPLLRVKALTGAGYLALNQEDYIAASTLLEESLAIGQRLGDRQGIAVALNWLGVVAWRLGDFERAAALYAQGLALSEEVGAKDIRTRLLNSLALLSASRGDFALARSLLEDCLATYRRTMDKTGIALVAGNLAVMVFRQGDYAAARSLVMESVELFRELGEVRGMASDLQLLGILAAMRGHPERAARILGAVEAVRETLGAPFALTERALYDYERYMAAIRGELSEEAFTRAWTEGRAMRLEKVVEYAQRDETEAQVTPDRAGQLD
jgi:predicted ATPase/class 3 adenylate cyclase